MTPTTELPDDIWIDNEAHYFAKYEGCEGYQAYTSKDKADAEIEMLKAAVRDLAAVECGHDMDKAHTKHAQTIADCRKSQE